MNILVIKKVMVMQEKFKIFTGLISSINRNIRRIKTEIMAEHNLKCPHVSTIYYLYAEGGMTLKELCEACNEDKGAVSRSVKSLEKEGLVEKDYSTEAKYKNKLFLTQKGQELGMQIAKKIENAVEYAIDGLSSQDKQIIYTGLGIISTNLEKFKITEEEV